MLTGQRPQGRVRHFSWMLGFLGFLGFRYFATNDPADLFMFSFLCFFSQYFTSRLAAGRHDERYWGDRRKAKAAAAFIPAAALFGVGIGAACGIASMAYVVLIAALSWSATFLTYALAFWYYEKRG